MNQIFTAEDIDELKTHINVKKKIVLVGGCFDILHAGHIRFLNAAKKQGDVLFVLLESDQAIQKYKGEKRPIHTQITRAEVLAELRSVDYVVLLDGILTNEDYDTLVKKIKPAIIATTASDPNRHHKERQARFNGAQVVDVIKPVTGTSTTSIAQLLEKEL